MPRQAAHAVGHYFPFPESLIAPVSALIGGGREARHGKYAAVDLFAGDGAALIALVQAITGASDMKTIAWTWPLHLCEIEASRAQAAQQRLYRLYNSYSAGRSPHMALHGDALNVRWSGPDDVPGTRRGAMIQLFNPPYDGSEDETLAFASGVLAPGEGLLVAILPHTCLERIAPVLGQLYSAAVCFRTPEAVYKDFKQVVIIARRAVTDRTAAQALTAPLTREFLAFGADATTIPVLPDEPEPVMALPEQGNKGLSAFRLDTTPAAELPAQLRIGLSQSRGGAWVTPLDSGLDQQLADLISAPPTLAMPPRTGHIGLALAAGAFNGVVLRPNPDAPAGLPRVIMRGQTKLVYTTVDVAVRRDREGHESATAEQVQVPQLTLNVLDLDSGRYIDLNPSDEISGATTLDAMTVGDVLAAYSGHLLETLSARYRVLHNPRDPAHHVDLPETARPAFPPQRQAVAAMLKVMAYGSDPLLRGAVGTGKSATLALLGLALSQRHFARTKASLRAQGHQLPSWVRPVRRVLVVAPPNTLGGNDRTGWRKQVRLTLPGAELRVIESHADFDELATWKPGAATLADPRPGAGMIVGLLSKEKAKLDNEKAPGLDGDRCPRCGHPVKLTPEAAVGTRARCAHQPLIPRTAGAIALKQIAPLACTSLPDHSHVAALTTSRHLATLRLRAAELVAYAEKVAEIVSAKVNAKREEAAREAVSRITPEVFYWLWDPGGRHLDEWLAKEGRAVVEAARWRAWVRSAWAGATPTTSPGDQIRVHLVTLARQLLATAPSRVYHPEIDLVETFVDAVEAAALVCGHAEADAWRIQLARDIYATLREAKHETHREAIGKLCRTILLCCDDTTAALAAADDLAAMGLEQVKPGQNGWADGRAALERTAKYLETGNANTLGMSNDHSNRTRPAFYGVHRHEKGLNRYIGHSGTVERGSIAAVRALLDRLSAIARFDTGRPCGEALFAATPQPRRMPLAEYAVRAHPGALDLIAIDELHDFLQESSAQTRAVFSLVTAAGCPVVGMTGTFNNGYAEAAHAPLWVLCRRLHARYGRDEARRFGRDFGYLRRKVDLDDDDLDYDDEQPVLYGRVSERIQRGRGNQRAERAAPGIRAELFFEVLGAITVHLAREDYAEVIPRAREIPVPITIDPDNPHDRILVDAARSLEEAIVTRLRRDRFKEGLSGRLLGALSEAPSYLDLASADVGGRRGGNTWEVRYPERAGSGLVHTAPLIPADVLLPKERWLVQLCREKLAAGRRILVYLRHTGPDSRLVPRLRRLLFEHVRVPDGTGERRLHEKEVVVLDTRVKPEQREVWLDQRFEEGARIAMGNPIAMLTGINVLTAASVIAWFEFTTRATAYLQANGRIDRLGQTENPEIFVPYYAGTSQELQVQFTAQKVGVEKQLSGDDLDGTLGIALGGRGAAPGLALGEWLLTMIERRQEEAERRPLLEATVGETLAIDARTQPTAEAEEPAVTSGASRRRGRRPTNSAPSPYEQLSLSFD